MLRHDLPRERPATMLRFSSPAAPLRRLALGLALALAAPGAHADPARISHLLHTDALFTILQKEGVAYGRDLAEEMTGEPSDPGWVAEVEAIHAPARLQPAYQDIFAAALKGADQAAIETWLTSDTGKRVVEHEISAREALLDPDAEDAAIAAAETAQAQGDHRFAAVERIIEAAGLIEPNVVGGMNANLAFYRAMAEGGAFPYEVTESDMLADVAAQEEEIRADVTSWIQGYLFLAYGSLPADDLDRIARFSASAPGQALLRAQFEGFDLVYEESSAALGAALARRMTAAEL